MKPGLALSLLLAGIALGGCREKPEHTTYRDAPVIVISVDTLRADHLPAYGYRGVETPALDAFAQESTVFERAYSHCPMTLPSHISMLTGLLPTEHGVRNNLGFRFDAAAHPSIPQLLAARGYDTGAAVSSYVLRGETGMRAMFDSYDDAIDPRPGASFVEYQRSGDITAQRAIDWIAARDAKPFFFFLHLYEPHVPYAPPEPFRTKYAARPYDGEIAASDAILGRFFEALRARGIYDRAIIIITSDHGEGLGDHGEQQHSILLYNEQIQVPLFVKLPKGATKQQRVTTPVSISDIAPTVAALTGIEAPHTPEAVNLFATPTKARTIYSETIYPYIQLGWSDLRSLVDGQFHYIDGPKPELYEVSADPHETKNVIAENRRVAAAMKQRLQPFPRADATQPSVDPEAAARLAALGYIGTARTRPDPRTLPNPRDVIGVVDEMQEGFALAAEGRLEAAASRLRAIVAKHPKLVDVWVRLGEVEADAGNAEASIQAYRNAMSASGVFAGDILASLASAQLQAGKIEEAEESARLARSASPEKATTVLARVALAKRDVASAEKLARELVASRNAPSDHLLLAEVLVARRDVEGAMHELDAADARGNSPAWGVNALRGDLFAMAERPADAIAAYEREIAAFPSNRVAYARLAVLYFLSGDRKAVDRTVAQLVERNPGSAARLIARRTYEAFGDAAAARRYQ